MKIRPVVLGVFVVMVASAVTASAQQRSSGPPTTSAHEPAKDPAQSPAFDMGKIVVVGRVEGRPGAVGAVVSREQIWSFDRTSLDQAVNVVPGVVSTFDSNGRRNESFIFVRGFGRRQVPLSVDGVRFYLPADNRLDFSRFLTADVSEVQIQKGYASVLDGPGAMGGAINLVTRKPTQPFEVEGSIWTGGRSDAEGWNGQELRCRDRVQESRRRQLQSRAGLPTAGTFVLSRDASGPAGHVLSDVPRRIRR